MQHNEIFIYSTIYANIYMLKDAAVELKNVQKDYSIKFEKAYVLVPQHLYIFDLANGTYMQEEIGVGIQYCWSNEARQMVEMNFK